MNMHEVHALLTAVAREAGSIGVEHYRTGKLEYDLKEDHSPVTLADVAIETFVAERLGRFNPDVGWLSEESVRMPDCSRQWMWVVDPIDGTRSFATGGDEWVVSIALVKDGRPMVGVLFRPATGEIYDGLLDRGARLNGRPLSVSDGSLDGVRIFTGPKKILRELAGEMPRATWLRSSRSLALRIARVAEGALDTALVKAGAHDWDLAAADLILAEAGGRLTTIEGKPPLYGEGNPCQPALIAAGPRRHDALVAAIRTGRASFA